MRPHLPSPFVPLLLLSLAPAIGCGEWGGGDEDAGRTRDADVPAADAGPDADLLEDGGAGVDGGLVGTDGGVVGIDGAVPTDAGRHDAGYEPPTDCPPAPVRDFREETIYFMMTTRFFDGDPSNNYYNRDRIQLGDPHWRGDFAGLIQQLDYIQALGFSAIWITPIVENRSGLDYHGYHGYDFTRVDPRLESPGATLEHLTCEMHRRGMRLVLDIVLNHSSNYGIRGQVHNVMAPIKYFRETGAFPSAEPGYPYQTHLGDYSTPNREDNDNPLAPAIFHAHDPLGENVVTCPRCLQPIHTSGFEGHQNHDPGHFFSVDPARLDTTWYHQEGYIQGGDWENPHRLQQTHLAGDTIDLNTENETVRNYLVDAYNRFLDMGVDAFRIDTLKHIERSNVFQYTQAFEAHRPGLFQFGEALVKGTGWGTCVDGSDNAPADIRPWWYTRTTEDRCGSGDDDSGLSVLDFSLFSTFRDNLSHGRFGGGLTGVLDHDHLYGDATQLVTFLDNHDLGPQNDWKYRFDGSDEALAAALNFLWTVRGIPTIFYGTEIRFEAGSEIDGNLAPHAGSGRAYFGDHLLPENRAATLNHPIARHLMRLNQIRRASPALQRGEMRSYGSWDNAFWSVREDPASGAYVVVGLAQGETDISVGGVRNGTYRDAVSGREVTVGDGNLHMHVLDHSAGIYILDGPGRVGEDQRWLR